MLLELYLCLMLQIPMLFNKDSNHSNLPLCTSTLTTDLLAVNSLLPPDEPLILLASLH